MVSKAIPRILRGSLRSLSICSRVFLPGSVHVSFNSVSPNRSFEKHLAPWRYVKQKGGEWKMNVKLVPQKQREEYPPRKTNMTMEHQPFEDVLPCTSPPRHQAPVCNTQKKGLHTLHTLHTSRNLGWGGGGWGGVQCHALSCTQLHLRTCSMLRNCTCTCAHVRCYAIELAHMFHATQLHLRACSMLRNCTCAHVRCYAIALAHMFDATHLDRLVV